LGENVNSSGELIIGVTWVAGGGGGWRGNRGRGQWLYTVWGNEKEWKRIELVMGGGGSKVEGSR